MKTYIKSFLLTVAIFGVASLLVFGAVHLIDRFGLWGILVLLWVVVFCAIWKAMHKIIVIEDNNAQ